MGRGDPSIVIDDAAWIAIRTPDGPATLRFETTAKSIAAEAWGRGADRALEQAPDLVGANDDPGGFTPVHPLVARLHRTHPAVRITRSRQVTEALLRAVVGQKVSGKEAKRSYRSMVRAQADPAPGPKPEILLPPDPAWLASLDYSDFHVWGIERRRAVILQEVSRRAVRLAETVEMALSDAYRRITALRGIGPWSAGLVGLQALGDADAVPVGDYHLPNTVSWALAGEARGDDDRMLELLAEFQPNRGRVVRLLKAEGITAPKYGPRAPLRNIERI